MHEQKITTKRFGASRVEHRPPILNATRALGISDGDVARMFSLTVMVTTHWAVGRKPIPVVRHAALLFVVGRLVGVIGAQHPPASKLSRRAEVVRESAQRWAELARQELFEEVGGDVPMDVVQKAYEMGSEALAWLEKREAS